jgi:uncharacterized membrane protein
MADRTPPRRIRRPSSPALFSSTRVEAFSDGVIAIAITLLVLDLAVPEHGDDPSGLGHALLQQWPAYFAYAVSFLVIGIIWVNHHTVFAKVRQVDRPVLFINLALLMCISVIPFPTRLLAQYLTQGSDSHMAAAVYSATMLVMGICFASLWLAVTRDARLLHEDVDATTSRAALRRFALGNVFYLLTVGLSFVNALATLTVHAALAVYYCFDQLPTSSRPATEPAQADVDQT